MVFCEETQHRNRSYLNVYRPHDLPLSVCSSDYEFA